MFAYQAFGSEVLGILESLHVGDCSPLGKEHTARLSATSNLAPNILDTRHDSHIEESWRGGLVVSSRLVVSRTER